VVSGAVHCVHGQLQRGDEVFHTGSGAHICEEVLIGESAETGYWQATKASKVGFNLFFDVYVV
jgi:hypothetical protein